MYKIDNAPSVLGVRIKSNLIEGFGEEIRGCYPNGSIHFLFYIIDGKINGKSQAWYENGQLQSEEDYDKGVIQGFKKHWHFNGALAESVFYINGFPDGLRQCWFDNGILSIQEKYVKGRLHGVCRQWYRNGCLKSEIFYKNGVRIGISRTLYETSLIFIEEFYRNGKLNGVKKEWFPNGQLRIEMNYVSGKLHGVFSKWDENGLLIERISFQNGLKDGMYKKWNKSGVLILNKMYVRDVEVPGWINDLIVYGTLDARNILNIHNAAVRRICLEEHGYAKFLAQLPSKVIDKDETNQLILIEWHKEEDPLCLVRVQCPSTGAFYILRVPPETQSVKQAIAWTFGLTEDEYTPIIET